MQKSGRLSDDSKELFERCGIKVRYHEQRLLAAAENMPIEFLRVRDDDIPGLVMDGVVDLGIIGENVLEETLLTRKGQGDPTEFRMLKRFDFGGCRLSIAIPRDEEWKGLSSLNGMKHDGGEKKFGKFRKSGNFKKKFGARPPRKPRNE